MPVSAGLVSRNSILHSYVPEQSDVQIKVMHESPGGRTQARSTQTPNLFMISVCSSRPIVLINIPVYSFALPRKIPIHTFQPPLWLINYKTKQADLQGTTEKEKYGLRVTSLLLLLHANQTSRQWHAFLLVAHWHEPETAAT